MPTQNTAAASALIVDDHPMVRNGIKQLLENEPDFDVVGEAGTIADARRLAQDLRPNLILLDLFLPDGQSLGLLEEVRSWPDPPKVIVLTTHNEADDLAAMAMRLGASGFVNKAVFGDQLLAIVREALAGKTYLSPALVDRLVRRGR